MCRHRNVNVHRVRYHHGPNCTAEAPPPPKARARTPEDERFRQEVVDLIMNAEPQDVPLRELMAEQSGPEPTLEELVMGQGVAADKPGDVERELPAIEGGKPYVSAEEYLRSFEVERDLKKREG
jgi:hypothetical protein